MKYALTLFALLLVAAAGRTAAADKVVRVFIFAGQSNMVGSDSRPGTSSATRPSSGWTRLKTACFSRTTWDANKSGLPTAGSPCSRWTASLGRSSASRAACPGRRRPPSPSSSAPPVGPPWAAIGTLISPPASTPASTSRRTPSWRCSSESNGQSPMDPQYTTALMPRDERTGRLHEALEVGCPVRSARRHQRGDTTPENGIVDHALSKAGGKVQATSRTRGPRTWTRGVIPSPGSVEARMKPLSRSGAPAAVFTVT